MFRRLREKLEEGAIKLPSQYGPFGNSPNKESSENKEKEVTEDLINLTAESSSIVVPHASSQQFSIAEEEEGSFSGQSTPQKKQLDSSGSERFSNPQSHPSDKFQHLTLEAYNLPVYQPPLHVSYVPQSDIESEIEEPLPVKFDGVSKEQLAAAFLKLKSRTHKYKTKYSEVVKAYKDVNTEKEKVLKALSESQDKALRRIAELREQCQLEQKAKAHLEENLRIMLEEKEDLIRVLETKVKLLKENGHADVKDGDQTDGTVKSIESSPETLKSTDHEIGAGDTDVVSLREKVKRQEALLNKCKEIIAGNKERNLQITQEKDKLTQKLEQKSKDIQSIQEKEAEIQAILRAELQQARERLVQLEHQQEESAMAMAETKRNMHEELELKEKQLLQAKEEALLYKEEKVELEKKVEQQTDALSKAENQHKEAITELQHRLTLTEKTLGDEKQNLMQELSRGKAAAISLIQADCEKKVTATVEEWSSKLDELQKQHLAMKEEYTRSLQQKESDLQDAIQQQENIKNMKNEDANQKLQAVETNRNELLKTIEELTVKNTELEDAICVLHEEIRKQQESNNEKTEKMEKDHEMELAEKKNVATNLEEQCKALQQTVTDLEDASRQLHEEMRKQQDHHKEEVEKIKQNHEKTLTETEHTIKELEEQCRTLQQEKEKASKMKVEFEQTAQEKDLCISKLQTVCDQLNIQLDQCNTEITDLKNKCEGLEIELFENTKQLKRQLQAEKEQALAVTESTYKEQLRSMESQINQLQYEKQDAVNELQRLSKVESEYSDLQISIAKASEEAKMWKEQAEKLSEKLDSNNSDYEKKLAIFESTIFQIEDEKKQIIKEMQDKLTALEQANKEMCNRNEDLVSEKETLMQVQNSLNSAKMKYEEEVQTWINKVNLLEDEHSAAAEKYQEEIQLLNRQLDESLLVAEANQGAAYQELAHMKLKVEESQAQLIAIKNENAAREAELMQQLQDLEACNRQLKEEISTLECIKEEKEVLNTRIKQLEEHSDLHKAAFKEQLDLLKQENEILKIDCINVSDLKEEKDQLNAKLCCIEKEKGDLEKKLLEQTEQLRLETESKCVKDIQDTDSLPLSEEKGSNEGELVNKDKCINNPVIDLEEANTGATSGTNSLYQQQLESVHKFFNDKLSAQEEEFNSKLKHLLKNICTEWELKDNDCDQTISDLIENAKEQEDKNSRDHRLEVADLQQQIFEKDSALEEMQEHYLEQLQEKELQCQTVAQEYEKKLQALYSQLPAGQEKENIEDKLQELKPKQRTEASDWEDSWEVTEEDGDIPAPILPPPILPQSTVSTATESSEKQCFLHMQQIKELQATLAGNQAELAHLKCLVGLTNCSLSSQPLNNSDLSLQIPEATEYEYLRNILFEYMMGKEPLILAKVIAAVLRFTENQTELILQKEEARQAQR